MRTWVFGFIHPRSPYEDIGNPVNGTQEEYVPHSERFRFPFIHILKVLQPLTDGIFRSKFDRVGGVLMKAKLELEIFRRQSGVFDAYVYSQPDYSLNYSVHLRKCFFGEFLRKRTCCIGVICGSGR
jgi:hypothetical protein